jgi:hypothetical protein
MLARWNLQVVEAVLRYCMQDQDASAAAELAGLHTARTMNGSTVPFQRSTDGVQPLFLATEEQQRHLPASLGSMVLKCTVWHSARYGIIFVQQNL